MIQCKISQTTVQYDVILGEKSYYPESLGHVGSNRSLNLRTSQSLFLYVNVFWTLEGRYTTQLFPNVYSTNIEYSLLCSRHSARSWEYNTEPNRPGLFSYVYTQHEKQIPYRYLL